MVAFSGDEQSLPINVSLSGFVTWIGYDLAVPLILLMVTSKLFPVMLMILFYGFIVVGSIMSCDSCMRYCQAVFARAYLEYTSLVCFRLCEYDFDIT